MTTSSSAKRYGMVIDLRKCVGCEACTVACKSENGVPLGHFRTTVKTVESGTFPKPKMDFIPTLCNHCETPGCVQVCPTMATFQQDGAVLINPVDCIGCQYCIAACPYGARYFNAETGVVDKCSYCYHRLEMGEVPACMNTCVARARIFGDLNDPNSEISKARKLPNMIWIENTATGYIVPEGFDRSLLPANYAGPAPVGAWQNILQPVGKTMLGGAAAAALVSLAIHAVKKDDESEKEG